jgi:hypothetical protein
MKTISLVLMSNVDHKLCEFAIHKTLQTIHFDEILIFSDKPLSIEKDYTFIELPKDFGLLEYSVWCIKQLYNFIKTDYFIIIQPDGMAINTKFWSNEFFDYDYIGAPFNTADPLINSALINDFDLPHYIDSHEYIVGNGGFSFRSKKLLAALQDEQILEYSFNTKTNCYIVGEDFQISVINKQILTEKYGIKIAPVDMAIKFSTETLCDQGYSFGFHGWQNLPLFLTEDECLFYLNNMRPKYDLYRLKRFSGFCYEKDYHRAMHKIVELREQWRI